MSTEAPVAIGRLVKVMAELPAIPKAQRNQQQNYMFRGIDDMMTALKPLLAKHEVIIVPKVVERVDSQRTTRNDSTLYVTCLLVEYTFWTPDGVACVARSWGEGSDTGDKATNKAMTSAYKYMLNQVFCISDADSVDADATSPEAITRSSSPRKAQRKAQRAAKDRAEDARAEGFLERQAQAEAEASGGLDGETQALDATLPPVPLDRQLRLELVRGVLRDKYGDAHRIQTYLGTLFGESYQGNLAGLQDNDIELLLVDLGLLTVENPLT